MTIREVRFNLDAPDKRIARALNRAHWGFTYWFDARLKPIRQELRGEEVKGVNIVNFNFFGPGTPRSGPLDTWRRLLNALQYISEIDVSPFLQSEPTQNIEVLMRLACDASRKAPWPQVRSLVAPLSFPLSDPERSKLSRELAHWYAYVGEPDDAT